MTIDIDAIKALRSSERARLERFADVFDRLDASAYSSLTDRVQSPEVEAAQERAMELVGAHGTRHDAVRAAVRAFTDAATVAYARRFPLPNVILVYQALPDRAEDRYRFLGSVERVVVAMILWEDLSDDDRDALVGPWAVLVDEVVGA